VQQYFAMRTALSAFALLLATASPALAADWREAESNHFRIIGTGDEKELRKFAERLEYFHGLLHLATGANEANRALVKVRVFIVPALGDVQRLYGAGGDSVAGFYGPRDVGAFAVVPRSTGDGTFTSQLVLFHEYAHHYMLQYTPAAYPSWYVEGFAEIASTASFERKGSITFGKAAKHREDELAFGVSYPVAKMIDGSYVQDAEKGRGWNYGDAWALSHYLTFGDSRRGQFREYLDAINNGKAPAEAAKVFGDLGDLQREVGAYVAGRSFSYRAVPITEASAGPISIRQLRPGEAQLVDMQIQIGQMVELPSKDNKRERESDTDFQKRLDKATAERDAWLARLDGLVNRLATEPAGWLLLADARCEAEQYAACTAAANRAQALSPSQRGLVRQAEAMIGAAKDLPEAQRKAQITRAQDMLIEANGADPNDPLALLWFYRSFAALGRPASNDGLLALSLAVELVPQLSGPRLTLAQEYISRKRYKEARATLLPLANSPHDRGRAKLARTLLEQVDKALAVS
jgi:hypothetical protein